MARVTLLSNGPSKFDVMLALFDRKNPSPRSVQFSLEDDPSEKVNVVITGISIEDGSGESWLFTGFLKYAEARKIKGWFRTDRRVGHFEYVK